MIPKIPDSLARLIHKHLPTMEHVDVLLFLVRVAPATASATQITSELQTNGEHTARTLAELASTGIIEQQADAPDRFLYRTGRLASEEGVKALEQAYRTRPVSLVRYVYERPPIVATEFAEAFRLRRPKE